VRELADALRCNPLADCATAVSAPLGDNTALVRLTLRANLIRSRGAVALFEAST
jgi:hypothetical protein